MITIIIQNIAYPYIQDVFWGKHPDIYVELYGMKNSQNISQLNEMGSSNLAINITQNSKIIPIQNLHVVPIKLKSYSYPVGYKPYSISISNYGNAIGEKIIVKFQAGPNTGIQNITIQNPDKVKIIQGGNGSGSVELMIDMLLPTDSQTIDFVLSNASIYEIYAWEGNMPINDVQKYEIVIEPCNQ